MLYCNYLTWKTNRLHKSHIYKPVIQHPTSRVKRVNFFFFNTANNSKQTSKYIRIPRPHQQLATNTGVISVGYTAPCSHIFSMNGILHTYEVAGKAIAVQAWTGPVGSRIRGWQVGRPPQAPLLRRPRPSGLWVCQAIFSGKLEMLIHAPFKKSFFKVKFRSVVR